MTTFTYAPGAGTLFTLTSTTFWAAITFDNNTGGTGATAAQLNNLGQGMFDPPTLGSSSDVFFQTTAAGSFVGDNPAGGFYFFGGSPVASFGWSFTGNAVVPEPSPLLLSSLGAASFAGLSWVRRRRNARP